MPLAPGEDHLDTVSVHADELEGLGALQVAHHVQAVGQLGERDVVVAVRNGDDELIATVGCVERRVGVGDDLAGQFVGQRSPLLGRLIEVDDHAVGRGMRGHLTTFRIGCG